MKLLPTILLAIILAGCNSGGTPVQSTIEYKKIPPQEAQNMIETFPSEGLLILDVRTQVEFDTGHIKNAVLLPYDEIKEKAPGVIADKNQTILAYCRTGIRSAIATKALIEMGYTNVFDIGGIVDWTGEIVR